MTLISLSPWKLDRERRGERAELFVRAGPVAPHDHRDARRPIEDGQRVVPRARVVGDALARPREERHGARGIGSAVGPRGRDDHEDRKSTRLNSSHLVISYAVFCLKKKTPSVSRVGPRGAGSIRLPP